MADLSNLHLHPAPALYFLGRTDMGVYKPRLQPHLSWWNLYHVLIHCTVLFIMSIKFYSILFNFCSVWNITFSPDNKLNAGHTERSFLGLYELMHGWWVSLNLALNFHAHLYIIHHILLDPMKHSTCVVHIKCWKFAPRVVKALSQLSWLEHCLVFPYIYIYI